MLVELDGICAGLEVDFETPEEVLLIELSGDHQIVRAGWNTWEGGFAGDVGADGGGSVGGDSGQYFLTFGRAACTGAGDKFLCGHSCGYVDAAFFQSGVVLIA